MHIENYWFGFVVCAANGVALSHSHKTLKEAEATLALFQKEWVTQ